MNIKNKLSIALKQEFPQLHSNIIEAVVWYITGGLSQTYDETYQSIVEEYGPEHSQDDKDAFVYAVLLQLGHECCNNRALIQIFEDTIQQVATEATNRPSP